MSPMRAPELLAERYKFARSIQAGSSTLAWLATDQRYGRQVVACALGEVRLKALEHAVGVEQTYLATLLDLIRDPAPEAIPGEEPMKVPAVAIAEYVPGLALHDQVKEGPLPPAEAVTMIARAAEALQALHAAGAVHGAVSPRSLIVAPSVARPAPVLVQLVAPASGAYSTPERLEGGGPTPENDVWALYATLYAALTGSQAFEGASKEELAFAMREQRRKSLADCGVDRPELEALIAEGLSGKLEGRRTAIADLIQGLGTWQKNRDVTHAEAAELARLSMDWGDEPPEGEPKQEAPKTPTATVEYAMFDDDAADDQTTVFLRPAALLEVRRSSEPAGESTNGVFDLPQPATPGELPAEPQPGSAPLEPANAAVSSKPPPLPERPQEPAADKPSHPNKRRAREEAALDALRSEAPPLDNEAQPPIPMFPLDALYASKPESAPPTDAAGDQPVLPAELSRRDTGMASRAPPKPKQASIVPAPAVPLVPPKIDVSSSPRRDSRPWQDLTQPSRIRIAERAKAAAAAKAQPSPPPQSNPWAWIAGILGALTLVGITALELERRSVQARPVVVHEPVVPPAATTAAAPAITTDGALPSQAPDAALTAPVVPTDGGQEALVTNPVAACVASYFPSGTFNGTEDLAFLCADTDFRGVTSQLHRSLVKAGAGKVTDGMREWATLGWYELGAAALVRIRCCPSAAPIDLPKYSSRCEALPEALAATAREPLTPAEAAPRAQALATTIRCLYLNGVPRPYHYGIQPSGANRLVFEGFLARAASRAR